MHMAFNQANWMSSVPYITYATRTITNYQPPPPECIIDDAIDEESLGGVD